MFLDSLLLLLGVGVAYLLVRTEGTYADAVLSMDVSIVHQQQQ